jgi:hypothetical protein
MLILWHDDELYVEFQIDLWCVKPWLMCYGWIVYVFSSCKGWFGLNAHYVFDKLWE